MELQSQKDFPGKGKCQDLEAGWELEDWFREEDRIKAGSRGGWS